MIATKLQKPPDPKPDLDPRPDDLEFIELAPSKAELEFLELQRRHLKAYRAQFNTYWLGDCCCGDPFP